MRTIGNIIWVVFGGLMVAIEYFLSSLALFITVIGIPFGIQTLKLAFVALWPFGAKISEPEPQNGCLNIIMNIIWFFVGGFWIMVTHLLLGVLFGITIIGIPFAKQHFKLASLAFTPFGRQIDLDI
ncbi:YccF domain-containing protein [Reichenbachiella versicolor]|uniref:YccF domain-containing protein n=1 Tax=Reichenbachiella versicolor TaxID=1821036 RepID=UPI000D6DE3FA|nr:YccF domain-containing protein [Reichenbachiella versicolor]